MTWKSALLGLALLLGACQARAEPPVWIVRDADSELVLFGSIHVLPKALAWKPRRLTRAMAKADDIWFELPLDAAAQGEVAALAAQRSFLPQGQTLSKLLTPADAARLKTVAADYGVDLSYLDQLQPWMAEVVLGAAAFRRFDASADDGVERALMAEAPARAKLQAFETPAEQIALFADGPRAEQLASLVQTLDELADGPDEYARILKAWLAGDIAALEKEAVAPLREASPGLYARLVAARNRRWTAILDDRLRGRGRTVVVVGMGHLVGPDGLPGALRALGYRVEGP
ncbi:TraB/GumN family protein [Phenylobacterium immobile]|uniref:TraB/GumN family protein n=1 Tax=Phenylobacterium immobile TaxID=21 RepID=UPI000A5C1773|nr:TraB/GumN family protein [Phenylobacterium immobile]